jgi:hypothetical protein
MTRRIKQGSPGVVREFDAESDVPSGLDERAIVYIRDKDAHKFQDGTWAFNRARRVYV